MTRARTLPYDLNAAEALLYRAWLDEAYLRANPDHPAWESDEYDAAARRWRMAEVRAGRNFLAEWRAEHEQERGPCP